MAEFNREWIRAAGIRAIKTVAQTAVATIGTAAVMQDVNWVMVLSASILAGILSILTSVAGIPEVGEVYVKDQEPDEALYYEDDDEPEDDEDEDIADGDQIN
ncbi:MAG: hypothetical protein J5959_13915 [Butyrivibrio sp.]|nr:hypothetical protein [Butyrivibrio sp.]